MFLLRRCKCGGSIVERVDFGKLEDHIRNGEKVSGVGVYFICKKCGKRTKLFSNEKLAKKDWKSEKESNKNG